jgi:class 3 adenylate cyclase/tetratricopeptide (TPR) repeat protein
VPSCPNCGEDNPERASFCLACATPLALVTIAPSRVRKTVTVVFCDVTGSTVMGERLDAESVRAVIARYFDAMRVALERHGGTVEKFIGDAVMAVFGIPKLHEDDALRAVRAASDMREALKDLNRELDRTWGVTVGNRIGVNTGEVVAGDTAEGATLVTGDTVNVAARFEQAASPGEILIGEATYRLVRTLVQAVPAEPLTLKGKTRPVAAYRLVGVLSDFESRTRRLESLMVGRSDELADLQRAFLETAEGRRCQLVTVIGQAGVGKSRLAQQFLSSAAERPSVIRGRCLSYGEGITYWPIAEAIRQGAAIRDDDTTQRAREKIASLVRGEDRADAIAQQIQGVLGLFEFAISGQETFWAIRSFLQALARRAPTVLVIDDLHWAQPTLLDLIEHVARRAEGVPLLLLCIARPDLLELRAGWGTDSRLIALEPLDAGGSEELIDTLLGSAALQGDVRDRILRTAGGNPLFIEETLSMLMDDGLLRRENGHWVATTDLSGISVPGSISALVTARLDRLPPGERVVLELGSVIGQVFHVGALRGLAPEEVRSLVRSHLDSLTLKGFIGPHEESLAGEAACVFRHILIRDAAYASLPKETRADVHEGFADWLEEAAALRETEYEEIIGHHLEQSYRYRLELHPETEKDKALAGRAGRRLASAGLRAFGRGDVSATVSLLGRAAALFPATDAERLDILPDLATALVQIGDFPGALTVLDDATKQAEAVGDQRLQARTQPARLLLRLSTDPEGIAEEALDEAEHSIELFEEIGDDRALAATWLVLQQVHWHRCEMAAFERAAERGVGHARRAGDRWGESQALSYLAAASFWGPTPAHEGIERCRRIEAEAAGDLKVSVFCRSALAGLLAIRGDFLAARKILRHIAESWEDLGQRVERGGAAQLYGIVEMLAGDPVAAEEEFRAGYEILDALGEKSYLSTAAAMLAEAVLAQGRQEEADQLGRVSESTAASDDIMSQVLWRSVRAMILGGRDRFGDAVTLALEAVRLSAATDLLNVRGDALMVLGKILGRAGRRDEAARAFREALELFERKGNVVSASMTKAALAE